MKKRTKELIVVIIAIALVLWIFDPFNLGVSSNESPVGAGGTTAPVESPRGDIFEGNIESETAIDLSVE